MWSLIQSGGWTMVPIILCSVTAMAIVVERFWTLQSKRVNPVGLLDRIREMHNKNQIDARRIQIVQQHSLLGRVLAAGLNNLHQSREIMKESIEDTGRHVALELGRYLNTLGTIANITPLLGLLGTVIGMIKLFAVITQHGSGDASILAGGIAEALVSTAAGLTVAIPSVMFHRFFRGRVNELVVDMEQEALELIEFVHGDRKPSA